MSYWRSRVLLSFSLVCLHKLTVAMFTCWPSCRYLSLQDVWRCAGAGDVPDEELRTVLSAAEDADLGRIVAEMTEQTVSWRR